MLNSEAFMNLFAKVTRITPSYNMQSLECLSQKRAARFAALFCDKCQPSAHWEEVPPQKIEVAINWASHV